MTALKSTPALKATGIEARCAATGMRMTEQRRVIARVLADSVDHPDVEELYRRCVAVDDKISISTVYRTVKLFEDAGIIERHDFREGRARYEQMRDSHHDHLINLRDGKVIEFTSEEIEKAAGRDRPQARLQAGRSPAGIVLRAAGRRQILAFSGRQRSDFLPRACGDLDAPRLSDHGRSGARSFPRPVDA
jgi:Fur family ferric uptake transcriptional regulator